MKNFVFLFAALLMGTGSAQAATEMNLASTMTTFGHSNSFIFVENGVSFAVYPDGEFDFYLNNLVGAQVGVGLGTTAITFNSGFNYNPYVQYDDFGAVVQVRTVPVFYDPFGRVNRIGNVFISYRNGRLFRFGGMRVYYNHLGFYSYHVGYINPFNRFYVHQPFHGFFVRPVAGFCMVYPQPYRRYYQPVRYTYHRPYHHNVRRAYARVGQVHRHHKRVERSRIYRNDSRVVARSSQRNNSLVRTSRDRGSRTLHKGSRAAQGRTAQRTETGRTALNRSSRRVIQSESPSTTRRSSRIASREAGKATRAPKRQVAKSPDTKRTKKAVATSRLSDREKGSRVASRGRSEKSRAARSTKTNPRDLRGRTERRRPR